MKESKKETVNVFFLFHDYLWKAAAGIVNKTSFSEIQETIMKKMRY